jgi:hypothetical protein
MPKLQIVCVTCGFIGYVDSLVQADDSGWKPTPSDPDGGLQCPACLTDARLADQQRARAAGRREKNGSN